jgi:soluble lytic murein transglycosylase
MIAALALLAAVTADPRPALVEHQLRNRPREALALTQREIVDQPDAAHRMGLDYLRGHLLQQLGEEGAAEAFGAVLVNTPDLALYSRYRMALLQEENDHPEVAAGLVASVVAGHPGTPLAADAVRLFTRALAQGGDCRLLRGTAPERMAAAQRRTLLLAQADCSLRGGQRELARNFLLRLLEENRQDEPGRAAAERLAGLISEDERGRAPMLLGFTFHLQQDFGRAQLLLRRALGRGDALSEQDARETRYIQAHAQLSQQLYGPAAVLFGEVAQSARSLRDRSRALYQQGRSYELMGQWVPASLSFRAAYAADPSGDWSAQSLLSALRLDWRSGNEASAATIFYTLAARRPEWNGPLLRAGLFLAASDIVRGRNDRAHAWLDRLLPGSTDDRIEIAYWRGRMAELDKEPAAAVGFYLEALRLDAYHPLSQAARARLAAEPLARTAAQEGKRLAAVGRVPDLYSAWLLLGDRDETGKAARRRLTQLLTADRTTAPYIRLAEVPIAQWPLWKKPLLRPEEKLLALGFWHEGAPAVRDQFPVTEPSLALTGSLFLSRAGETASSIQQADVLRQRTPERVPLEIQPRILHVALFPVPYRDLLQLQSRLRGVDPDLLAAVIREESRFDTNALSPDAARGLFQLNLPAARRTAATIDLRIDPDDLYRPEVSIALGATALAGLERLFNGSETMALAAYDVGEPQAMLWRTYCYTPGQLDEYFTKIGSDTTRAFLRRVLASRAHYAELY